MKIKNLKQEEGIFSAILLIFLVTLALMGAGAFVLMKTEGEAVAINATGLRLEYAANGGVFYAVRLLESDSLDQVTEFTLDGVTVYLDTTIVGSTTYLNVTAGSGGMDRDIIIEMLEGVLADKAILTTGDVYNCWTRDSTDVYDDGLLLERINSIPDMDITAMQAVSTAQTHYQGMGTFIPLDNYPNGDFYYSPGVANVTYVPDDMIVKTGRTVYGIFLIEDGLLIETLAQIEGVVYLLNNFSTDIAGGSVVSDNTITGGIVSNGDITGTGLFCFVRHHPEFMRAFNSYATNPNARVVKITNWDYE